MGQRCLSDQKVLGSKKDIRLGIIVPFYATSAGGERKYINDDEKRSTIMVMDLIFCHTSQTKTHLSECDPIKSLEITLRDIGSDKSFLKRLIN